MPGTFYEQPILNSPYSEPVYHHPLDDYGQPLEQPAILGRRTSKFIVPVPKSRKASAAAQASLDLETYTPNSLINEIRGYVNAWRQIRNQADWGVTPASARLLDYWRNHQFSSVRPFFCQVEAVETVIWLTEVAPKRAATKGLLDQIQRANDEANPQLFRLAMKMATGSGKTTVMAMLIAWQTVNAVRRDSKLFSRAFLIVTPGITIKDRLRVLMPSAPDNYYEERELVPPEMLNEVKRAEIVITNYHAFQHRETGPSGKVAKGLLQGNDSELIRTTESDGEMLRRAGAEVMLKTSEALTTQRKELKEGQRVHLEVAENVMMGSRIVIPAGSPAVGELTDVRNKGMWGKSGHINGRVLYARVGDRQIRLSGAFNEHGSTGTAGVVAAIVFIPIAGFLMTGTSARMPIGTPVKAFLDEDLALAN